MRAWAMATISVLAFCTAIPSAQAMSFGGAANALRDTTTSHGIEKIAYRRCRRSESIRYCRPIRTARDPGPTSSQSYSSGRS